MPVKKKIAKKAVAKSSVAAKKPTMAPEPVVECEVHRRYVLLGACSSCEHLPMPANRLVVVLSVAIVILSGLLISTSRPLNLDLQMTWGQMNVGGEKTFVRLK